MATSGMSAPSVTEIPSDGLRSISIASAVGTAIENFDGSLFVAASALAIVPAFLPTGASGAIQLQALLSVMITYVARPFGALLFGYFGDRRGRKATLLGSLVIMGGSTFLIGLLPTSPTLGLFAFVALCVLRFCQGFSAGGEYGGALLLAIESVPPALRVRYGTYPQIGSMVGAVAATLSLIVLVRLMPPAALHDWGWRLPFFLSACLLWIGVYVRKRVSETPQFKAARANADLLRVPARTVFTTHGRVMLLGGVAVASTTLASYASTFFLPFYMTSKLGYEKQTILSTLSVLFVVAGLVCLVAGRIAGRVGRWSVVAALQLCIALAGLMLPTLAHMAGFGPAIFMGLSFSASVSAAALTIAGFAPLFPVEVRYTGVSLTSAISAATVTVLGPLLIQYQSGSGDLSHVGLDLSVMALVSLAAASMLARMSRAARRPGTAAVGAS